jgi:guanine deaminase
MQPHDTLFLKEAIHLSGQELRHSHGRPFGAIVVKEGQIIGRGFNRSILDKDPTAHAEIVAIRNACANTGSYRLDGTTLYSSSQPCPMCFTACLWAGIARIVFGCSITDTSRLGFEDEEFYKEICLPAEKRRIPSSQLLQEEALAVLESFNQT